MTDCEDDAGNLWDGEHCLHDREYGDQVCCRCGDLFLPRHPEDATHGPYAPKSVK